MKKIIILLILLFPCVAYSQSKDVESLQELMAVTKMAGMCGVLSQMARFQETTQMKGGDEFIVRFTTTEAARLGFTLEDFLDKCVYFTKLYGIYKKELLDR